MNHTNVSFKKIYEHDMDLLILEEFFADRAFAKLFLDKINFTEDYVIDELLHSFSDANGESDITIILRHNGGKTAILIEDKIDAPTMEQQSTRYQTRAESAEKRGDYHNHYIMLVAPEEYLDEHQHDKNADYKYKVSYETLRDYLAGRNDPRGKFKADMIDFAIREKKTGYQVIENRAVTEFWKKLRRFCEEAYPDLSMLGQDSPKGGSACWPEFRTALKSVKVIYKSQRGFVDLEFPQYGDKRGILHAVIGNITTDDMKIVETGKSASVRMANKRWEISFTEDFNENEEVIAEVLSAVSNLCELASKINYADLY